MSLHDMADMRQSNSLIARMTASAAQQAVPADPMMWVQMNLWALVKDPVWVQAWAEAKDTLTVNQNQDLGARTDVISDEMIGDAVTALLTPEQPAT